MIRAATMVKIIEEAAGYLRIFEGREIEANDAVEHGNRVHDDILHRMEKPDCLYAERARLATKLAASQKERRMYKDWLHTMGPVLAWLKSPKGKQLHSLLSEIMGHARKAAKREEGRP